MHSSRMHTVCNSSRLRGGVPGPGECTWSWGVYLAQGMYLVWRGVPGPRGVCLVWGVYLVPGGGVPGLGVYLVWRVYLVRGVYLVWGDVPGPGGCSWSRGTWSWGCTWSRGCTWSQGYLPRYSPSPLSTDRHV